MGENGAKDLLDILQFLYTYDQRESVEKHFPSLKNIFVNVAEKNWELTRLLLKLIVKPRLVNSE